jgi:hypothetical protein
MASCAGSGAAPQPEAGAAVWRAPMQNRREEDGINPRKHLMIGASGGSGHSHSMVEGGLDVMS